MSWRPGASTRWMQRHPWLAASLLLHALALFALWVLNPVARAGGDGLRRVSTPQQQAQVSASLQQARRLQMQRQIRELERVQRELAGDTAAPTAERPLPSDEAALRQRAREVSQRIQAADQQRRAGELAQLLKIPQAEARRRVQADPRSGGPRPQASLTELTQDAKARLHAAQAREQARQQGQAATTASRAGGAAAATAAAGAGGGGGRSGGSNGSGSGSGSGDAPGIGRLAGGDSQAARREYGDLVALDSTPGRVGQGRRIGPGGEAVRRLLLDRWYLVGPFDGSRFDSIETVYPPELAVDLDAVYEGKDGRLLGWAPLVAPPYPLVPDPRHADAVYYAVTEIHSQRAQTVYLDLGADDDAKLWLNDELVWRSAGNADKPWYRAPWMHLTQRLAERNLSEARVAVRLQPGPNRLLLKLYNGIDLTFFSVVVVGG